MVGTLRTDVLFQPGRPERLELLVEPLSSFDLAHLLAHGDESTIWEEGGLRTTRGTDSDRDVDALVPGTTVQTHLGRRFPFGRRFVAEVARQMHLESGFFSIFASRDAVTTTHYDRNHNFTIQLSGEKTWTVYGNGPAVESPSDHAALQSDRLAATPPQLHGATPRGPDDAAATTHHLTPGAILYVPPGHWHATRCRGLSISLNVSLEPRAWFQVLGKALVRHLESDPRWRAPFGTPTADQADEYVANLQRIVARLTADDVGVRAVGDPTPVGVDQPLRRTLGSLLMWEADGAGIHYAEAEVRFVALGTQGRWVEVIPQDWLPVLEVLAALDDPTTVAALSAATGLDQAQVSDFAGRLTDLGYLTAASADV